MFAASKNTFCFECVCEMLGTTDVVLSHEFFNPFFQYFDSPGCNFSAFLAMTLSTVDSFLEVPGWQCVGQTSGFVLAADLSGNRKTMSFLYISTMS